MILIADTGEDFDYGDYDDADTESDGYKSISSHQSSYRDYDEYHYGYKPKKKKIYVPVFVTEKEKKKSKHFLYISEVSVCSVHYNTLSGKKTIHCVSKKRHPFYFCDIFVKFHPILLIFGRNMPQEI